MSELKCKFCNEPFTPGRSWQQYCSSEHRLQDWINKNPRIRDIKPTVKLDDKELDKLKKLFAKLGYHLSSYIMNEQGVITVNIVKIIK